MSALLLHFHLLLLKGDPSRLAPPKRRSRLGTRGGNPRIRCPACGWEPKKEDRWMCECLYSWHTFDTFGVCPACDRRWTETQCPQCQTWSPHLAWYGRDDEARPDGSPLD